MSSRTAILLALACAVAGCGEAETPRFTPAGPDAASAAEASPGDPTREATPAKNIATH